MDGLGEALEDLLGGGPVDAGVGDGLAVDEFGEVGVDLLISLDEV